MTDTLFPTLTSYTHTHFFSKTHHKTINNNSKQELLSVHACTLNYLSAVIHTHQYSPQCLSEVTCRALVLGRLVALLRLLGAGLQGSIDSLHRGRNELRLKCHLRRELGQRADEVHLTVELATAWKGCNELCVCHHGCCRLT